MKEILKNYASYNLWASQRLLELILTLPVEQQRGKVPSSFDSLLGTILHMWDAESIWWQRVKLQEHIFRPSENFSGTMKDAASGLLSQSRQWEEWVHTASDLSLDHVFSYMDSKKEQFKQPVFQTLLHIFNHGSYHRGQLVTILHNLGQEKIPNTDYMGWVRRR